MRKLQPVAIVVIGGEVEHVRAGDARRADVRVEPEQATESERCESTTKYGTDESRLDRHEDMEVHAVPDVGVDVILESDELIIRDPMDKRAAGHIGKVESADCPFPSFHRSCESARVSGSGGLRGSALAKHQ